MKIESRTLISEDFWISELDLVLIISESHKFQIVLENVQV